MYIYINKFIVSGIVIGALLLGFAGYVYAAGSTITLCANRIGLVYAAGDGFLKKKCDRSDQSVTIGGDSAPADIFNQSIRSDKRVYAVGEYIKVACGISNGIVNVYDLTPGIDGVASRGGYLISMPCGIPFGFQFKALIDRELDSGHEYVFMETESTSNCTNLDYALCKTFVDGSGLPVYRGEVKIRIQ